MSRPSQGRGGEVPVAPSVEAAVTEVLPGASVIDRLSDEGMQRLQAWAEEVVGLSGVTAVSARVEFTDGTDERITAGGALAERRLPSRADGITKRRRSGRRVEVEGPRSQPIRDAFGRPLAWLTVDLAARSGGRNDTTILGDLLASQARSVIETSLMADAVARYKQKMLDQGDELRNSSRAFRITFDESVVGMAMISLAPDDAGRFLRANDALRRLTGYGESELTRMTFADLTHPDDRGLDESALRRAMAGRRTPFRIEKRYLRADGDSVWVRVTATPLFDDDGHPLYFLTQVENLSARLDHAGETLARQDELTGALNNAALTDALSQTVDRARRHGTTGALFFAEIDGSDEIAAKYGPDIADQVQIEVARRLRSVLRGEDQLSRTGDNLFAFIAEEISEADSENLARRINAVLERPELIGGHEIRLGASLGVTMFGQREYSIGELLHQARKAMMDAKTGGGGTHTLYSSYGATDQPGASTSRVLWADPRWEKKSP